MSAEPVTHCEKCGAELNGEAAYIDATDETWCHSCADNAAEAAWERHCSEPPGPSLRDQQIAALRFK